MKKINLLLTLATIICAIVTIFMQPYQGVVVFLKNASIILTVTLPYILQKLFKVRINDGLTFIWIIFIFMAHYLGVVLEWHYSLPGFDKVTHTVSGVLSGYVATLILKHMKITNLMFSILFIISFSFMCAGLWEIFEFTCNALFGGDAQRVAETGVTDTMLDIIVAFGGSIFVSIVYFIKKKK